MTQLELQNLKKYYAAHKAVDDISFSISQGDIFGLLGPNGAGKTTLIRMITGIIFPDNGSILFREKPFDPRNDIFHIGYMPEERGLYKKMKIGEQALYLAMLKGLSRSDAMKRVKMWFEKFEMQNWWNKKTEDLSKGMSQKLQFVTTVLHEPELLILDEPFSGLDPVNSNLIKEEILRLNKAGTTIIFSTHRMEQVEELCQRIVLVNKGKKILDGDLSQIKNDFKEHIFNIGYDGTLPQFESQTSNIYRQKDQIVTVKIGDNATPSDVLKEYLAYNTQITSFNEVMPTLNEIFIRLVEELKTTPAFSDAI
ncbi:MAG TPA: ATP-binding cassette domain-containing protein [Ginsengibacter sp.]|nr:ATP-binding cassette domain-containing protein [Ginsengibacter sp.]HRP44357.1 ATP-binding cassette domain-containing protein [Ginsengibacter sp.]